MWGLPRRDRGAVRGARPTVRGDRTRPARRCTAPPRRWCMLTDDRERGAGVRRRGRAPGRLRRIAGGVRRAVRAVGGGRDRRGDRARTRRSAAATSASAVSTRCAPRSTDARIDRFAGRSLSTVVPVTTPTSAARDRRPGPAARPGDQPQEAGHRDRGDAGGAGHRLRRHPARSSATTPTRGTRSRTCRSSSWRSSPRRSCSRSSCTCSPSRRRCPDLRYGTAFMIRQTSFTISNAVPAGGAIGLGVQYGMLGPGRLQRARRRPPPSASPACST